MSAIGKVLPLLICVALLLANNASGRHRHLAIEKEVLDLKTQLESTRKNSIKTIKTASGDVYDCVDIYKQPAFLHPELKDHKVQMKPTIFPTGLSTANDGIEDEVQFSSEEVCPQGSVPIQRLDLDMLARDKFVLGSKAISPQKVYEDDFSRFWAISTTHSSQDDAFYGGGAAINCYAIPNVGPHDNSAGLIWIMNTDVGAVLRAGWQVRPGYYNDNKTRLFIEWITGNDNTVCVNDQCPGFVVTNPTPMLGWALTPLSVYLGQQFVTRVYIYMDPETGNWWFAVGKRRTPVGYWPKAIFDNKFNYANRIDCGGFVSCAPNKRCPPMCNGVFPGAKRGGFDCACFVEEVQFFNMRGVAFNISKVEMMSHVTDAAFSTVGNFQDDSHGFTFGGPGF